MLTPSTAETKIIQSLIAEKLGLGSPFLKQIPVLRFPTRYMTGTGYFMEFDPLPESLRAEPENTVLSTDFGTKLPSPRDVVGFTLFIDGGFMSSFEGYTFGDVAWPEQALQNWLIMGPSVSSQS
ncbi:MAG: hypothetical protein E6G83_10265 [Alphaproteobacteria bacterium]|nr:MAG: hypothetical protein E6G83_10265 [Alphaproteobacteria bacterium]